MARDPRYEERHFYVPPPRDGLGDECGGCERAKADPIHFRTRVGGDGKRTAVEGMPPMPEKGRAS